MMIHALDICNTWQHVILLLANHMVEEELHDINISREMPTLKVLSFLFLKKCGS